MALGARRQDDDEEHEEMMKSTKMSMKIMTTSHRTMAP